MRGYPRRVADRIELRGLRANGRHGVLPQEREADQPFVLDVDVELDLARAGGSDDLADTVDYGALAQALVAEVGATRFDLLEALGEHLCGLVLADPRVSAVRLRVGKPRAPITVPFDDVAVVLRRERSHASPSA